MEKYEYLLLKAISGPHFFTNEDLRMNKKINIFDASKGKIKKYRLKNKNARVEVRATDRKGNVYKCSKITDGRDITYALYDSNGEQ